MISQSTCVLQISLHHVVTYFLCQSHWVWDTWITTGYFLFRQLICKKSFKKRKSLAKLSQMRAIHMRHPPVPSDLPDQGSCSHPCLLSSFFSREKGPWFPMPISPVWLVWFPPTSLRIFLSINHLLRQSTQIKWIGRCYGLNCVPPKFMFEALALNVSTCWDRVKWSHQGVHNQ